MRDTKLQQLFFSTAILVACVPCGVASAAEPQLSRPRPATDREIDLLRPDLDARLKDGSSARLRDVYAVTETDKGGKVVTWVCGKVNAKNSFGAYEGFFTFYGSISSADSIGEIASVMQIDSDGNRMGAKLCRDLGM